MASDGHCQNIRNAGFRQMGVSANSKATQTFGGRGGAAADTLISGIFFGGNFVAVAGVGTTSVRAWVGNEAREMSHVGGGIFQASGAGVGSCVPYFFEVGTDRRSLFPAGPSGVLQANCNVLFSGAAKTNSPPPPPPPSPSTSTESVSPTATATPGAVGNGTVSIQVSATRQVPVVPTTMPTDDSTVSEGKQSEDKDSNAAPGISIGTGIAAFSVLLVAGGFVMRKVRKRGYGFSDVFPAHGNQQPSTLVRGQFETYLGSTATNTTTNNGNSTNVRSHHGPQRLPIPAALAGKMRPTTTVEIQGVPADDDRVMRALAVRAARQQQLREQYQTSQQQPRSVDRMMAPTLDYEPTANATATTMHLDVPSVTTRHRHATSPRIEHALEVGSGRQVLDGGLAEVRPVTMVVDQDMGDMDNCSYLFSEQPSPRSSRSTAAMRQERTVSFVESEDGVEDGREVMQDIVARANLSAIDIDTLRSVSSSGSCSSSTSTRKALPSSKPSVAPIITTGARRQSPSGSVSGSVKHTRK